MKIRCCLVAVVWMAGCATTGDVTLHVPATAAARVPANAASVATARAAANEAAQAQALATAQAEAARTTEAARAAHVAPADTPELAAVAEAQRRHAAATVAWRAGVVDMMRWRLAAAQARVELELAMFLARGGDELDIGGFQRQVAQLQRRQLAAARHVAELHAAVDADERALAAAKERYAASRRAAGGMMVTEAAPAARDAQR